MSSERDTLIAEVKKLQERWRGWIRTNRSLADANAGSEFGRMSRTIADVYAECVDGLAALTVVVPSDELIADEIRCGQCDQPIPDNGDIRCVDCLSAVKPPNERGGKVLARAIRLLHQQGHVEASDELMATGQRHKLFIPVEITEALTVVVPVHPHEKEQEKEHLATRGDGQPSANVALPQGTNEPSQHLADLWAADDMGPAKPPMRHCVHGSVPLGATCQHCNPAKRIEMRIDK